MGYPRVNGDAAQGYAMRGAFFEEVVGVFYNIIIPGLLCKRLCITHPDRVVMIVLILFRKSQNIPNKSSKFTFGKLC